MPDTLERWEVMDHGPLEEIDDGILTVAGTIKMPLGSFPRRMTVVRLASGGTAIWSAVALNEPEMARIDAMGTPAFLIVPSDHHRLDAGIWKQRYPDLRVLTPPGAKNAVREAVPVDATTDVLGDPAVRFVTMPGTGEHEGALVVKRDAGTTLVVNDLIGNLHHPDGLLQHIVGRLMGFGVAEPQVPRVIRHKLVEDPKALARQFRDWAATPDLQRIIVSHGDPIEADPAGVLNDLAETLDS
ncbi:MAG: hypothetical protein E7773_13905 [Sphingomonas sp.]|uniref:hypothetical protein n=1 Tax=Sphingomonas sp. TaxID=28214 RepID=UPI00120D1D11|nr:hypothetical protein [Sphingomonas sp.]THD34755.1 MAG: hypothetical protein E7773_13905 [Sphingomonas sp.]